MTDNDIQLLSASTCEHYFGEFLFIPFHTEEPWKDLNLLKKISILSNRQATRMTQISKRFAFQFTGLRYRIGGNRE